MRRKRYVIMMPASSSLGVKGGPVEVDPSKLHIGLLTEIYEWDSRTQQYVRAHGVDTQVQTGIDATELLQHWQDLMEQIQLVLPTQGLAGSFSHQLSETLTDLPEFIKQLAEGKIEDARKALDVIGYGLLSVAATVTEQLAELESRASQQGGLAEIMTDIVAGRDDEGLYAATAQSLAQAIDNGLRTYRSLVAYETELNALYERLEPRSRAWSAFGESSLSWLRTELEWLAHDETGFCTRASRYLISPDPEMAEAMAEAITEARGRLQKIRERIAATRAERATVRVSSERTLEALEEEFSIDQLLRTMRECREAIAKYTKIGIDTFSIVRGLITTEELTQWHSLLTSPQWQSLHAVKARLRDKVETIRQLLDQTPQLTESDQRILDRTEQYIERLVAALAEFNLELDEAEAAENEGEVVNASSGGANPDLDSDRLEELYELMMAIGAVKFCGPENMIGTTPRVMLDLLVALGRLTSEEKELYHQPLQKRFRADSYEVKDGERRLVAWQETNPKNYHWIQFRQGRGRSTHKFTMWRLVEQARTAGLGMCVKHGLDPVEIVAAYNARRAKRTATMP